MTAVAANAEHQIVITVEPSGAEPGGLLKVDDALRQVLAFLRVAEEGKSSLGRVHEDFEWFLYQASTQSPFRVVATAIAVNPTVDVTEHVTAVKEVTSRAFQRIVDGGAPPGWLRQDGVTAMREFFGRNANGIARTMLDFINVGVVEVDQAKAAAVAPNLQPLFLAPEIPARTARGEIEGRLVTVGRYYNRPALNLRTSLYGLVWCVLADNLVEQWGDEQRISAVWRGKRLIVYGRLLYGAGGKLSRVEVENVREREAPRIDIEKVFDSEFTSGLDPVEYLERLHEGKVG